MKKLALIILALIVCFSFTACIEIIPAGMAPTPTVASVPSGEATVVVPSEEPTATPTPTLKPTPTPTPTATPTPLPSPQTLPKTGLVKDHVKKSKKYKFYVKTKKGSTENYYVKLFNSKTGEVAYEFFVRAGATMKAKVGSGTYLLRYATGTDWYGTELCFGPDTSYTKSEKAFKFYRKGNTLYGWTVTLYKVENGNLFTLPASPDEFK